MRQCQHIYFRLPPRGAFQKTGASDPLPYYYFPVVGMMYRQRIQCGLNLLENHAYSSVLEFGYGNGLLLPTLNQISKDVSAIDLCADPDLVKTGLSTVGARATLYKGDIRDAGFKDSCFDLVVAFSVFEHIKDCRLILEELHRILKKKGFLLFGMPRVDKYMNRFFRMIGFKDIDQHHVTDHHEVLAQADGLYQVERSATFPFNAVRMPALYYNFLLKKV